MSARCVKTVKVGSATVRIYIDRDESDEYVCRLAGNPRADYFTNDLDDAIGTAKAMAEHANDPLAAQRRARAIWG